MTPLESAVAALQGGDATAALSQVDEILAHAPGDTQARYVRAVALARLARVAEALVAAKECLRANPGDPAALELLDRLEGAVPAELAEQPEHYQLGEEIARGGMGRILAARGAGFGRPVAIKEVLSDGAELVERFDREARVTARLQHPAIVPVYGMGRTPEGRPFYAMKLVSGRPLDQVIAGATTLDARLALLPNLVAVADAMAYAHTQRVLHRDLKPANVLCGEFGETVVVDWGLAKSLDEPEEPGRVMGTPAYMPPEQARGEAVDARTDVYALGAMLHHLLDGQPPYAEATGGWEEVLARVIREPPAPLAPETPADLRAIVAKAMARDPAARYPTARELAEDLRRFQTGKLVAVYQYSAWELIRRWVRRHRAAVSVAAVALLVVAIGAVASVRRIVRERDRAEARRLVSEAERLRESDPATAAANLLAAEELATLPETEPAARRWLGRDLLRVLPTYGPSLGLAVTHDGKLLAASGLNEIRLWDTSTWRLLAKLVTHEFVMRVDFSDDGKSLVAGQQLGFVTLFVDEGAGWTRKWEAQRHEEHVINTAWHAEGILTAGLEGKIGLLRPSDGAILRSWQVDRDPQMAVGPDGAVAVYARQKLFMINPSIETVESGPMPVLAHSLAWVGQELATGLEDGRVIAGDQNEVRAIYTGSSTIMRLRGIADPPSLIVGTIGGRAIMIDARGTPLSREAQIEGSVTDAVPLPEGQLAIAGGQNRIDVRRVRSRPAMVPGLGDRGSSITALALSPAGDRLAIADASGMVLVGPAIGGKPTECTAHQNVAVRALAWSPDGRWLASGGTDGVVTVRETLPTCGPARSTLLPQIVATVSFSADGTELAAAPLGGGAMRWRVEDLGKPIWQEKLATVVTFEPRGRRLAGYDRTNGVLLVWNGDGAPRSVPLGPDAKGLTAYALVWQPGGERVALTTAEGRLIVASADGETPPWEHRAAGVVIPDARWSGDGHALAVAQRNGKVVIFDPEGTLLAEYPVPVALLDVVAWNPDGARLWVGGMGGANGDLVVIYHHAMQVIRGEMRAYVDWAKANP